MLLPRRIGTALLVLFTAFGLPASASDWIHWRGPEQNGHAKDPAFPATFALDAVGQNNLVWKTAVGGRSSPLLLGDKLFTINARDPNTVLEGERVSCFDANTGDVLWHYPLNVYHADVVTSRLGWTTLTADPAAKLIYTHTTAGALVCLDTAGKLVWQRHLTEEFGRFTGYGGRIVSPVFDSGLVICAMVNSNWGDQVRGANRFVAFDGKTGELVWWSEPSIVNKGTYQSTPVIAVIGGQRLVIAGGASGALVALKVRTGEPVWTYPFSSGAINPSPVVDGDLVYGAHGEENLEGGPIGRVVCVDASQIKGGKPKLVWEYRRSNRFGLSHPALADGRLYVPDDSSEMFCFDAKTGKLLWRERYGTDSRGAPVIIGDRLFVFDVSSKLVVMHLNGDNPPDPAKTEVFNFRVPAGAPGFCETHGTPIVANGRMYFTTQYDTFCIGATAASTGPGQYKPMAEETPFNAGAPPTSLQIFPAEAIAKPGGTSTFKLKYLDANGREVNVPADAKPVWSLPTPPLPKGATTGPPPLKGEIHGTGAEATLTIEKLPSQQGLMEAKVGTLTARARVRVVPQIPYVQDFEKVPVGAAPAGWVNTQGKFVVKQLPDGNKVLAKVNTDGRPPLARANGYITLPTATGYTIEADLMGTEVEGKLPDMGIINNRYTLILDGKRDPAANARTIRLASWDARPRVSKIVPMDWKKDTWYRTKLVVEVGEKTAVIRGKVWDKSQPEPEKWTVEFEDPGPNREGAAGVYGYVSNIAPTAPGSEIYYDNVSVKPNK